MPSHLSASEKIPLIVFHHKHRRLRNICTQSVATESALQTVWLKATLVLQLDCEQAAYHWMEPCRTLLASGSTTNSTLYTEDFYFDGATAINCTGPDAGATLDIEGDLTPSSVTLPEAGFQCDCVCDPTWPSRLGTLTILLRATDVATSTSPNYQYLTSQCSPPSLEQQGQVFVTTCDSPRKTGRGDQVRYQCCGSVGVFV